MRGHDLNLQTFSVARTTVRLRHLLPRKSLESVFHFSAVTSGPVSIGTCGKNWRDIVDDDKKKKVGTYGASAEKLCGADNVSTKRGKKKTVITVETWRRREAQGGRDAICDPTSCDTSNLPPGGPPWTSQLPRWSSHQARNPKGEIHSDLLGTKLSGTRQVTGCTDPKLG